MLTFESVLEDGLIAMPLSNGNNTGFYTMKLFGRSNNRIYVKPYMVNI